ncbi:MAG: Ku protein, partial [Gemmatimonadota bacterium]|nr:Ku protein [Gemmatimonadota bacterium]
MPDDAGRRAPRAFWSGAIAFGLVTVPVELLPAARSTRVSLKMLAPDGTPLSRRYWCPADERLLDPAEIVRGYEVADGEFVVVTEEELDALEPDKSREIDLRRFVPRDSIDPIFFERAYFLAPSGASSKAYRLLAMAMERCDVAGVGAFVMRGKEYLAAILSEGGILRAETLRFDDELREPEDVGLGETAEADPDLAGALGEALDDLAADALDPDELTDARTERIEALVRKKLETEEEVVVDLPDRAREATDEAEIIDLMEVLKRRLKGEDEGASPARSPSTDDLGEKTKKELYALARELEIEG